MAALLRIALRFLRGQDLYYAVINYPQRPAKFLGTEIRKELKR